MQLYFSHSYRDVSLTSYFLERFKRVNQEKRVLTTGDKLRLCADQKSKVWCVAKLERFLFQLAGFVSVIPRRPSQDDGLGYSEYIAYELTLARRARAPRLLFVDDEVLRDHREQFPADAVPFLYERPEREKTKHEAAIRDFKLALEEGKARRARFYRSREVTIVAPDQENVVRGARELEGLLRQESYNVTIVQGRETAAAFKDIGLLESLHDSELCVFLLGEGFSYAHVVLAMAHAQCIPSIRFQYDPLAENTEPDLSGVMRWKTNEELLAAMGIQLFSFQRGFVEPLDISEDTKKSAVTLATEAEETHEEYKWDFNHPDDLILHVDIKTQYVRERVDSVSRAVGGFGSRSDPAFSRIICSRLYDEIRRRGYYYEVEYKSISPGIQEISPPEDIASSRHANCLDLACLFGAMLEAAHQRPIIIILAAKEFAHALAGYWQLDEIAWDRAPGLGELRDAVRKGYAVLFEGTGAVESEKSVAAETDEERRLGKNTLDFTIAEEAAVRLLNREGIELKYVIDVTALREKAARQKG